MPSLTSGSETIETQVDPAGSGSDQTLEQSTTTQSTPDATVESFLKSLEDGSIADGVPADETQREPLADESGRVAADPALSVHANRVRTESKSAETAAPKGVVTAGKAMRDLEGFSPQEQAYLKQMSQEAYAWASEQARARKAKETELATLAEQLKSKEAAANTWLFQHDEAYTLSPEYKELTAVTNRLSREEAYWTAALEKIENGEAVPTLQRDKAHNLYLANEAIQPNANGRAQVIANLARASQFRTQAEEHLQNWSATHKQRFNSFREKFTSVESQLFPQGMPEELKPYVDSTLKMFPAELRNQPEYRVIATANALIHGLRAQVDQLSKQLQGQQTVRKVVKAQGPGDGAPATAASKTGATNESIDSYLQRTLVELS